MRWQSLPFPQKRTRSSATTEIARDADKTAIQGHSRSSVVALIDAVYNDFPSRLQNFTPLQSASYRLRSHMKMHQNISFRWKNQYFLGRGHFFPRPIVHPTTRSMSCLCSLTKNRSYTRASRRWMTISGMACTMLTDIP